MVITLGWSTYNSERAAGKLEVTISKNARDYVVVVNWKAAEKADGKYIIVPGKLAPIATAFSFEKMLTAIKNKDLRAMKMGYQS